MKKLFFIIFLCALFIGCASNNVSSEGGFITEYDEVRGVTSTIHEDLQAGMIYNIRDNLAGEREHVMLVIQDNRLGLGVLYQYRNWAFLTKVVFIANGQRMEIKLDNRQTSIVTPTVVREGYSVYLSDAEAEKLRALLAVDSCAVAFIGDKYTTDKIAIKPKIRAALLATIERYNTTK